LKAGFARSEASYIPVDGVLSSVSPVSL